MIGGILMCMTIVVNILGGPGAGKTVAAWEIAAELKKNGYIAEYVPEYAKEFVWEDDCDILDGSYIHQRKIYDEQKYRIDRLYGKVDFIVTDAPLLLSAIYLKEPDFQLRRKFERIILSDFSEYRNFNLFIDRGNTKYETKGRVQNYQESLVIDTLIKNYLKEHKVFCPIYKRNNIDIIVDNIIMAYKKKRQQNQLIREKLNQIQRQKFYISSDYQDSRSWKTYKIDCKETQGFCIMLNELEEEYYWFLRDDISKTFHDFVKTFNYYCQISNLKEHFGDNFIDECFEKSKLKVIDSSI